MECIRCLQASFHFIFTHLFIYFHFLSYLNLFQFIVVNEWRMNQNNSFNFWIMKFQIALQMIAMRLLNINMSLIQLSRRFYANSMVLECSWKSTSMRLRELVPREKISFCNPFLCNYDLNCRPETLDQETLSRSEYFRTSFFTFQIAFWPMRLPLRYCRFNQTIISIHQIHKYLVCILIFDCCRRNSWSVSTVFWWLRTKVTTTTTRHITNTKKNRKQIMISCGTGFEKLKTYNNTKHEEPSIDIQYEI